MHSQTARITTGWAAFLSLNESLMPLSPFAALAQSSHEQQSTDHKEQRAKAQQQCDSEEAWKIHLICVGQSDSWCAPAPNLTEEPLWSQLFMGTHDSPVRIFPLKDNLSLMTYLLCVWLILWLMSYVSYVLLSYTWSCNVDLHFFCIGWLDPHA